MTLNGFERSHDEEFSIPINISDIINICKDFSNLGWKIQQQIENILDLGVEESIEIGNVKQESLPFIKFFLKQICNNPYFGDAVSQAQDCLALIHDYENKYQISYSSNIN